MFSSKILVPTITLLASLVAVLIGIQLASNSEIATVFVFLALAMLLLMIGGRNFWWIVVLLGLGLGGFAYFGFRLHASEVCLALAFASLLPSIGINPRSTLAQHRPHLPSFFAISGVYMLIHLVCSDILGNPISLIEHGNILRAYFSGIWPIMFVFLFRSYGRTDLIVPAIFALQAVYLLRTVLGMITIVIPSALILPGVNFVLPGSTESGTQDLRYAGFGLVLTSLALLMARPRILLRVYHTALLGIAGFAVLLGQGRLILVASCFTVFAVLLTMRYWKSLTACAVSVVLLIGVLNLHPDFLYKLDPRAQRALSILVFDFGAIDAHYGVVGSNQWHARLTEIAFARWTSSLSTFFFGTGIKPFDTTVYREKNPYVQFEAMAQGAADTGNYESALWAILTPTGLVGFLLYLAMLFYFAAPNLRRLWKNEVSGYDRTIAFIGGYTALFWLIFSPKLGGYPGFEMILGSVAFYYFHDRASEPAIHTAKSKPTNESVYSAEV